MYKILIVDDLIKVLNKEFVIQKQVDYVNIENLEVKLKNEEYDLIYISNRLVIEKITKMILYDYMLLPKMLNKLSINERKVCSIYKYSKYK